MKKIFTFLSINFLSVAVFAQPAGIQIDPIHPVTGVTTVLTADAKTDIRTVYRVMLDGEGVEIPFEGHPGKYKLESSDSTAGFFFIAHPAGEAADRSGQIVRYVHGKNSAVKGAYFALYLFVMKNKATLLLPDADSLAVSNLENEFLVDPKMKAVHLADYLFALGTYKKRSAAGQVLKELDALSKQKDLSADDLLLLRNFYDLYDQPVKSAKYASLLQERFPDGIHTLVEQKAAMLEDENYARKLQFYKSVQSGDEPYMLYHMVINDYIVKNDFQHIHTLLAGRPKEVRTRTYNIVASAMIVKHQDPKLAEKYANWDYDLAIKTSQHPVDEFDRRYASFNLGKANEIMGDVMAYKGRFADALPYFDSARRAVPLSTIPEMEALYLQTMAHSSRFKEVKEKLEQKVKAGAESPMIKEALNAVFIQEHGSQDSGFKAYYGTLVSVRNDSLVVHVKNTMINMPAPDFTLEDLQGQTVSLASLKGKVVVVDFWATWCGPCIASFPGMQQATEKYKEDKNVVFLFVNAWERIPDQRSKVTEFLKDRKLPFTILLDKDDKAITAFGVKGIPTKFIIDKNGNIRFNVVGNPPAAEALVSELSSMIELVKRG